MYVNRLRKAFNWKLSEREPVCKKHLIPVSTRGHTDMEILHNHTIVILVFGRLVWKLDIFTEQYSIILESPSPCWLRDSCDSLDGHSDSDSPP